MIKFRRNKRYLMQIIVVSFILYLSRSRNLWWDFIERSMKVCIEAAKANNQLQHWAEILTVLIEIHYIVSMQNFASFTSHNIHWINSNLCKINSDLQLQSVSSGWAPRYYIIISNILKLKHIFKTFTWKCTLLKVKIEIFFVLQAFSWSLRIMSDSSLMFNVWDDEVNQVLTQKEHI